MSKIHSRAGFTLIDIMVALTVFAIVAATAVPMLVDVADSMKLGQAQRDVYQELQTARLVAVSSNQPIRVRFDCPLAGNYRITELIGTPQFPDAKDTAGDRCDALKYPYPAADNNPTTRPNHDGPMRTLPSKVSFGAGMPTLEFWPDGTVHRQTAAENPWDQVPVGGTGVDILVVKDGTIRKIRVNGLGKIELIQQ